MSVLLHTSLSGDSFGIVFGSKGAMWYTLVPHLKSYLISHCSASRESPAKHLMRTKVWHLIMTDQRPFSELPVGAVVQHQRQTGRRIDTDYSSREVHHSERSSAFHTTHHGLCSAMARFMRLLEPVLEIVPKVFSIRAGLCCFRRCNTCCRYADLLVMCMMAPKSSLSNWERLP